MIGFFRAGAVSHRGARRAPFPLRYNHPENGAGATEKREGPQPETPIRMEPRPKPPKPLIGLTCRWEEANGWYYLSSDYGRAVAAAGGIPVQIPLLPEIVEELAARLDGFVLCGSPSDVDPARYGQPRHAEVRVVHREREETDRRVLEHAFREKKPVLGICFGMQSLNVYRAGTLVQHIPAQIAGAWEHKDREARHPVALAAGSRLAGWAGGATEIRVNSTHHQSLDAVGGGLRVVARAPDGVIEAVEGDFPDHFVIGVQWHPERIWEQEPLSARVFRELVRAAETGQATAGDRATAHILSTLASS